MLARPNGPPVEDKRRFPIDMSVLPVLNVCEHLTAPVGGAAAVSCAEPAPGPDLRQHYPEVAAIDETSRLGRGLRDLLAALDAATADTLAPARADEGGMGSAREDASRQEPRQEPVQEPRTVSDCGALEHASQFRTDLIAAVPHLRRFALSLTRDAVESDDLVQFTLLKAWEHQGRFQSGTRLIAWLFTILRNGFLNGRLKRRREVPDPDGLHAARLSRPADQEDRIDVRDLQSALDRLEPAQREALLLIAVDDLSYEEAAAIIGCPRGTVKSRVSRARDRLTRELGDA